MKTTKILTALLAAAACSAVATPAASAADSGPHIADVIRLSSKGEGPYIGDAIRVSGGKDKGTCRKTRRPRTCSRG